MASCPPVRCGGSVGPSSLAKVGRARMRQGVQVVRITPNLISVMGGMMDSEAMLVNIGVKAKRRGD